MHINIYNSIKVNFLDFKLVNTIQDVKKETTNKDTYSHPGTYIHEVSEDIGPPPSHPLPKYIKYEIITDTNHTYNNAMVSLAKTKIQK